MKDVIIDIKGTQEVDGESDVVEVTTKFGRVLTAIVARPREIEMPITRDRVTRLELKQATE